ncbi:murein biosynthesis integral membrane protein MurJ [Bacillus sp. CGMCC 1.16541]|uniref:murein biosynthesis integral membrane protein MurJ n=1 Tax=Bacillus sp. CGMCC 1.16541 TaxID=2185143 RepID=UPI000D73741E|nr:murein biosynthesis integral membrane protein MurJ [Bacillus sp. CGMCC 1.16541]
MAKKSLFAIIGIVTIINVVSRLFGFIREAVIGYHFGTSSQADSVILAYTIPTFLYMVVGGAITTAFISIYKKIDRPEQQKQFKELILTYTVLIMGLLSIVFVLFAKPITSFFFTGLSTEEARVTAFLFAVMAPSTLFLVTSMWLSGVLNVHDRFFSPALATLLNNAGFVLLAVLLYPAIGIQAYGVGAVVGAVGMFVWLIYDVRKNRLMSFRFRFFLEQSEYVKRMLKIGIPILLGGATLQFYFLLHRVFASELTEGFIAALNYSSKLVQLPQVILMTAVTTVIYPKLAGQVAKKQFDEVSMMYEKGIRLLFLFIVPVSIFLYFYAEDTVRFIFEYGSFTTESTRITAELLQLFVIGMFAHAANVYVTRFFYAMEHPLYPVVSGVIAVFGLNIALIVLFIDSFGAHAIAAATTISAYAQLIFLFIISQFVLKLTRKGFLFLSKYVMLSILLTGGMFLFVELIPSSVTLVNLMVGFIGFIVLFLGLGKLCRISEIEMIWMKLTRK